MSVNEWFDPKVLVAIYAAILSTINILITIFSKRRSLKVRIFVERKYRASIQPHIYPTVNEPILHVEITNKSKIKIHIKNVVLNYSGIEHPFIDSSRRISFPKELGYGEVLDCSFNLFTFKKDAIEKKRKIQACVVDTLNKEYKSNSLKFVTVKEEIQLAQEESRKIAENFNKAKI